MPTPRLLPLVLALALFGCESSVDETYAPQPTPIASPAVAATLSAGATGQTITITNPSALPANVQAATRLQVVIGGQMVDVTRNPDGSLTFTLPATATPDRDKYGNYQLLFVMDQKTSQFVTLATGSQVQFNTPAVTTNPSPATIVQGLDVQLTANTSATTDQYTFGWSYAASPQGPFQAIPGQGKQVVWTPPAAGSYYVKIDAVNNQSQQDYSTVTSAPVVFVNQATNVITTNPSSGAVTTGQSVSLNFNAPTGFTAAGSYAWAYAQSPQGPWTPLNGNGTQLNWLPPANGNYYVQVAVQNAATGKLDTFVTPTAAVLVSQSGQVITPSASSVNIGDAVTLTLNAPGAGNGPFNWFVGQSSPGSSSSFGATSSFTQIQGANGKSITYIATSAGSFSFSVQAPQPDGTTATFTTTSPILNVAASQPIIQSVPPNTIVAPGSSVTLQLNARGLLNQPYNYVWSVSSSPALGLWTSLPITHNTDLTSQTFNWNTPTTQAPGAYYVQVIATQVGGTNSYTFTSSTPVVTLRP